MTRTAMAVEYFVIKSVNANDSKLPIVLQNENGPCPIVALLNTMVWTDVINNHSPPRYAQITNCLYDHDSVLVSSILEVLGEWLMKNGGLEHERDMDQVLQLLPSLVTGMNINVKFDGSFDDTREMSLFRLFGVPIVHGWVADSSEPAAKLLLSENTDSYDKVQMFLVQALDDSSLVPAATLLNDWLEQNVSQLTVYGLQLLHRLIDVNVVGILFRNDHYSTITNVNGQLYVLVTDIGFKNQENYVWHTLSSINGDESFVTAAFFPSEGIPELMDTSTESYDADLELAKKLQMKEDERLARSVGEPRSRTAARPSTRSGAQTSKDKSAIDRKKKDPKDKKDCILM